MKLLTGAQIREWDAYTIANEPVSSIDLMERASRVFVDWFRHSEYAAGNKVNIFCGNGNNGGDGLAIARMLRDYFFEVKVYVLRFSCEDSTDFDVNLGKLLALGDVAVEFIHDKLPEIPAHGVIIDALLGTGVTRPVTGKLQELIQAINCVNSCQVISVDMPSGLPAEGPAIGPVMEADIVCTFQVPKLSFFHPENAKYCPRWVTGNIRLTDSYLNTVDTQVILVDQSVAGALRKSRTRYQHKGDFGHVMIVAGSDGKSGAAILSTKACLRSGAGLVTACVPEATFTALNTAVPEAMTVMSGRRFLEVHYDTDYTAYTLGIGPGLGREPVTANSLEHILRSTSRPVVLDADALNILADDNDMWGHIPQNSILTPHPGEFKRLFGESQNSFEMYETLKQKSAEHCVIIVLKGAFTRIATPEGKVYINSTGNPGMATAGAGDVLTGIITGLLAQNYSPGDAAILGVYIHGLAGDLALVSSSPESLIAGDITDHLGQAFTALDKL